MFTFTESEPLTHDDCLENGNGPCAGAVEFHPRYDTRYVDDNRYFPRCEAHYAAYAERCEARIQREIEAEARQYCKHGTFVGDPYGPDYICGQCEFE
jgi:hypothetical protein